MQVTQLSRARPARFGALIGLALGLVQGLVTAAPAFAEDVVIPYECDARGGDVRLVPSESRSYRVLGARDRQVYSVCDPADPGQCKNYQIHRFDLDCGGVRVSWLKVSEAVARLEGERVSVKRNQMLLEIEPAPNFQGPYSSGRWDPDRRAGNGDPYGVAEGEAVVSFPPGFAPALGVKPMFTEGEKRSAAAAPNEGYGVPYDQENAGGWETEAKGWSQSPRGEPVDEGARAGWDADKVASAPSTAPSTKSGAAAAPAKQTQAGSTAKSGASYGTETVTSQQLPEIGAKPAKTTKAAAAPVDAAKAAPKKVAAKPAETVVKETPKAETAKQETAKAEPPKSEPAKTEAAAAEAPKFSEVKPDARPETVVVTMPPAQAEPVKATEAPKSEEPKADAPKTEAAMIEPPKGEVKPADAAPAASAQQPEMINGKNASSEAAAKLDAPPAPATPAPQEPQKPAEAEAAMPPPLAPAQPSVVAEATLKPEAAPSSIETSSISIVGQKVPLMPALFAAGAALVLGAGFFLMMRRDQDAGVAAYVERDIARVSLEGSLGGTGARLSGPSFELPMPGTVMPELAMPALEPVMTEAPAPFSDPVLEAAAFVTEPALPPVDAVMEPAIAMPEFDHVPALEPLPEAMAAQPMPPVALADEPAPEALELARALAEATAEPDIQKL